jgi:hypothetical protein
MGSDPTLTDKRKSAGYDANGNPLPVGASGGDLPVLDQSPQATGLAAAIAARKKKLAGAAGTPSPAPSPSPSPAPKKKQPPAASQADALENP